MKKDDILKDLPALVSQAVARYWETRATQRNKQKQTGKADQGLRNIDILEMDLARRFRLVVG